MSVPFLGPDGYVESGEELLALALSTPASGVTGDATVTAQIDLRRPRVTVELAGPAGRRGQVLCSKECIEWCIGLYRLWRDLAGWADEEALAYRVATTMSALLLDVLRGERRRFEVSEFAEQIGAPLEVFEDARAIADRALRRLEDTGLVYDPVVIPGLFVFGLGLIPVRWSVRTAEGEQIYRDIDVRAKLWSYSRVGPPSSRKWDFEFRGINWVERLLDGVANNLITTERTQLQEEGRPTPPPTPSPTLQRDDQVERDT